MLLIGNGILLTMDSACPLIDNGCVVIEGKKIIDRGETAEMRAKYAGSFIDARGNLILPGLINAHMHIYSAMARGMKSLSPTPNKTFGQILDNLWWPLDKALNMEEVRYSAYTTYIDCIRRGVTTVFDHHASYSAIGGSLFALAEVARELGVRTSLCFEVSYRIGQQASDAAIRENLEMIRYAKTHAPERLSALMGLHASFTLSDETLSRCATELAGLDAGYHVHCAEGPEDLFDAIDNHHARVLTRLNRFGVLGEKSLAVHCIHIDEGEIDLLGESGTAVVHNPQSNMGNAVGCARVPEMIARGVTVGLGTDGYTADMLESMKTANLIHKHRLGDPSAMWGEPIRMLFETNRAIAARHFPVELGVLKAGAAADVIVARYSAPTPVTEDNYSGHLHFGLSGAQVETTVADGKVLMQGGELLVADEARVYARSRELSQQLWDRF